MLFVCKRGKMLSKASWKAMLLTEPRNQATTIKSSITRSTTRTEIAGIAFVFLVCVLTALSTSPCLGQAWTMPRGEHFVKITGSRILASEQLTFDGRSIDFANGVTSNSFKDESLYLYGEFGVWNNLTLILSLPYKRLFIKDLAFKYQTLAMGTSTVGLRVALLPLLGVKPSALSLALNLGANVPMGYTRNFAPSAGPGQVDAQASLGIGLSFYPTAAYLQASAGYRLRTSMYAFSRAMDCNVGTDIDCIRDLKPDYGNEFIFSADAGIMFLNGTLFFQVLANGVWSVEEPFIGFTAINPIPTLQRYIKTGAGFAMYPFRLSRLYAWSDLGFSVQYFITPYGRNTIASSDIFVGIEYRIRF